MSVEKGWVFVAGASRGIGLAATRLLLEEGYSVVAASRNQSNLDNAFGDAPADRFLKIAWDFRDIEGIEQKAKREVFEKIPVLSGLVCTIGAQKTLPLSLSKYPAAEELFRINTFAPIELVRVFSKFRKIPETGSSFVLISSLAAHEGALGKTLYAASKGALEGFLPPAASELAERKIRLNILIPGIVKTGMSREFLDKMSQEQLQVVEKSYPLGLGEPNHVAKFIRYLISNDSSWITGQSFVLDGGHSIRGA